jgi:hypothetical protein
MAINSNIRNAIAVEAPLARVEPQIIYVLQHLFKRSNRREQPVLWIALTGTEAHDRGCDDHVRSDLRAVVGLVLAAAEFAFDPEVGPFLKPAAYSASLPHAWIEHELRKQRIG